ncbi:protein FAM214A [Trichosurus vulpecula]|uniref:protein FAM214A n=1 Tax=Trichosurus vulpecula TaxID=9337 RepID=UPI00186AD119|nr:protein FAM214A [Trichosurus vulpecula]XP_036591006.1 protein FAM214A [Trichosurus vulpecula]XP_036591007.1 protein FAM214A [Trichosurus vulpecula]
MKPDRDTLDEYFEYDAEEFLVSLALLITEGRTPECSVKGRTESFHCPPAQSSYPIKAKHECSDKLAQCRQARRTRSEVMLLWKNNLPVMVEVMLLPDCCYSDDGPNTEGNDLNDPAIKQDALLLERWILEPVPRQNGDRFIEEKTLLLAVRSFVFFSQLSAWLSVSHGAIPRNILYRISAADVDLQWNFSQTPTEHVFPVPNVSHNVALKVSVQSLPRQSSYPVLTCSIHTNIDFYEKRIQEHELKTHQRCNSKEVEQCNMRSSHLCSKQAWTVIPEGLLRAKTSITPEFNTTVKNFKLYPGVGHDSDLGTSQSSLQCFNATGDAKPFETSVRTSKSLSWGDPNVSSSHSSWQPTGETSPLIGSLIQDRQEVIARIAQHLIDCDPTTSRVSGRSFNMQDSGSFNSKIFRSSYENENLLKKNKENSSVSFVSPEYPSSENTGEGKTRLKPENSHRDSYVSSHIYSRQSIGETNPLIGSLLQERQEVIARIAQHLIHCDPSASHIPRPSFNMNDSNSVHSKVFRSSYEDKTLLKKSKENSVSFSNKDLSLSGDNSEGKSIITDKSCSSLKCSELKTPLKTQIRRNAHQEDASETVQSTFQQTQNKPTNVLSCLNASYGKEIKLESPGRLENTLNRCQFKDKEISSGIDKQYSNSSNIDEQTSKNKHKERTIKSETSNPDCFHSHQLDNSKTLDSSVKSLVLQASDHLPEYELRCPNKDPKTSKACEQNTQLVSIENYQKKDTETYKCKSKPGQFKTEQDENEDPVDEESQNCSQRKIREDCSSRCERLKSTEVLRTISVKHSSVWRKHNFHSLDGTSTKAFHPQTGLPLLSSPVPQRKTQSGCFDLDTSLLHLKNLPSKSPQQCLNIEDDPDIHGKPFLSSSAPPITSLSLLGNFEESVLNYRLDRLGIVDGFTAEVGASGVFCPTHMTLPVEVSFYSVSDDNAPSPYMGVITLESLGKRGYRVPPSGTIQVTLFNPNKTVVKMFVVIYDLRDMPANHQTFLRQRTFSVPAKKEMKRSVNKENIRHNEEKLLRYLIHLRFQSSKSGKIYLHRDVRLLFSRKSMEVDSGAAYELKSYTESPTNPQFSPRC